MGRIIGIRVVDHVDDVEKALDEKIELALGAMGEVVEGYAKEDCPVDTGLLRNSITYAVAGQSAAISSYHASRRSTGKSAGDVDAGTVRVGRYSGIIGDSSEKSCYVGSNVEYAPYVEFRDATHKVGKAHFLRDGAQNHINELKAVAEAVLSTL